MVELPYQFLSIPCQVQFLIGLISTYDLKGSAQVCALLLLKKKRTIGAAEQSGSAGDHFKSVSGLLLPGMVTSNEPAVYREGMHGIRHENIVLCRDAGTSDFGEWLEFETLTLCHIDTSAVIPELLGAEQLQWLREYNIRVYETLSPLLPEDVAHWLKNKIGA